MTAALLVAMHLAPMTAWAQVPVVTWDERSLLVDGHRVAPVMGEVHYSRIPEVEWADEVRKMKEGGVTMVATYVFWNHVEEVEGQFDWSGRRNLRRFLQVCKAEQMPVVLRLGPFCHGEVRNGGIPDWVVARSQQSADGKRPMRMRSTDARWLSLSATLYRQIFTQVQGLQWKDGGPVVAVQFDNEYRGSGDYLTALKRIAREIGFDLPFYTRTGWPELSKPVPFGEILPLYGDYADGFWERSTEATAGNYWKAFFFQPSRDHGTIGTDMTQSHDAQPNTYPPTTNTYYPSTNTYHPSPTTYPYFTCELGGGMATAYHRRPYMYPEDALAMAVVKLGSGSNLLGYYMYHGGTNPEGKLTTLNENQRTPSTNNNDMPVLTYDFQAPLGEFGQRREVYYRLRPLHLFMKDYGEVLAATVSSMRNAAPDERTPKGKEVAMRKGDDSYLRWCYRSTPPSPNLDDRPVDDGRPAFVFFNNYERLQHLSAKRVRFEVEGVRFPLLTIPAGAVGIFPVNVEGMRYATAQLVARRDGKVYLMQVDGIPVDIALQGGKTLRHVKPRGMGRPVCRNIYLLTQYEAERLFLTVQPESLPASVPFRKTHEAGPWRTIRMGAKKVAEAPTDDDFALAATYVIDIVQCGRGLMAIDYQGDCARLYAGGRLVADNFYDGHPFEFGLWRLPGDVRLLELRVLPMQSAMPIYFPAEADTTPGERVAGVTVAPRPAARMESATAE